MLLKALNCPNRLYQGEFVSSNPLSALEPPLFYRATLKGFEEENPIGSGRAVMYETVTIWPLGTYTISVLVVVPTKTEPPGKL